MSNDVEKLMSQAQAAASPEALAQALREYVREQLAGVPAPVDTEYSPDWHVFDMLDRSLDAFLRMMKHAV
jgi:hypothetical protein